MAEARKYILIRRGQGIANLQPTTLDNGDLTVEQAESEGVYKVNCTHQIGIATSTEVGLSEDRFAVRVIVVGTNGTVPREANDTVCSYWKVTDVGGNTITFNRKPIASELALRNLYKAVPDLDAKLWAAYEHVKGNNMVSSIQASSEQFRNDLYDLLTVPFPTEAQVKQILDLANYVIQLAMEANNLVWFKVTDVAYLVGSPHGFRFSNVDGIPANKIALLETLACAKINAERMTARHDTVSDGMITLAAFAVANMFRTGMAESYEHREYYTVCVVPDGNDNGRLRVKDIRAPAGAGALQGIGVGDYIDVRNMKLKKNIVELAHALVIGSGLMHYLFNHTTGGVIATGTLLTTLSMYGLVSADMSHDMQVEITSVCYEALHPTNKRLIANMFFRNSGVFTAGRSNLARRFDRFEMDTFMSIRSNPYPAGSHKAFICLQALKRVLQSGLGPFLPWAEQIGPCVNICKEVLSAGARAHIGSSYYTGDPPRVQPAALDGYLPELAQYVQTFNKGDSLSMSPHMANDIAKRSSMNWQNLLKDLKSKDVSGTDVEIVRQFLTTTGNTQFTFDPNDQSTWATAMRQAGEAAQVINNIFS